VSFSLDKVGVVSHHTTGGIHPVLIDGVVGQALGLSEVKQICGSGCVRRGWSREHSGKRGEDLPALAWRDTMSRLCLPFPPVPGITAIPWEVPHGNEVWRHL
jgi:hypothetical protein